MAAAVANRNFRNARLPPFCRVRQIIADLSHPFAMLVFMAAAEPNDDPSDEPNDHIVSKGWQKNFANDTHQVTVVDVATCQVVQRDRPIKNNFAERGFMTQIGPNGEALRNADKVFQKIERRVLNKVREIAVDHRITDELRDAVVQLFTIHLVRSQAFRDSQFSLLDKVEPEFVRDYPRSPEVLEKYQRHFGRLPYPGEVEAIVMQWFATRRAGGVAFDSIKHSIDTIEPSSSEMAPASCRVPHVAARVHPRRRAGDPRQSRSSKVRVS